MKQALFFFTVFGLLSSVACSVEKRQYRRGYYVDRANRKPGCVQVRQENKKQRGEFSTTAAARTADPIAKQTSKLPANNVQPLPQAHQTFTAKTTPAAATEKRPVITPITQSPMKDPGTPNDDRPVNRLALLSLLCAGLAVIAALTLIFGWGFAAMCLVFAPLAVVFGLIARKQVKNDPGKYRDNWFATVGIVVGGAAFLLAVLFIGAVLVALSKLQ